MARSLRRASRWWLAIVVLVVGALLPVAVRDTSDDAPLRFRRMSLPGGIAGDCKMVGDLDGDGLLDVVVGGTGTDEPLTWYRQGTWEPRQIAVSEEEFSNDCAIADINQDGFSDIVVPDATVEPANLFWFTNPGPDSILETSGWRRHPIGHTISWCKDVRVVDLDGDGRFDVVARPQSRAPILFFQEDDDLWARVELLGLDAGREGMASGDVDSDGYTDLVIKGAWVRNPGGGLARIAAEWTVHSIGEAPEDFKAFVADVDGDSSEDILFSSSEDEAPIVWWKRTGSVGSGWVRHVVAEHASSAHTLWSADLDLDGDRDVIAAELGHSRVTWYQNLDGRGARWRDHAIAVHDGGIHNGMLADLDRDGDLDLFGAGFTGQPTKATIWWNQLNPERLRIGPFTAIEVTQHHVRALGSAIADLDADGLKDIAAGPYWYRNPGGDMTGSWEQHTLPQPGGVSVDVIATVTLHDQIESLVAMTPDASVWWLQLAQDGFRVTRVGRLPEADHGLSSQGVEVAALVRGDAAELVLSSGGDAATGLGIYAFRIVADGPWPRRRITDRTSDEGIAVGDIDGDGDLDVIGTRGDRGEVEWYANPGGLQSDWSAHPIAALEDMSWLDRVRVSDLNCDGRLDVVVTEENGKAYGAETYWLEQPADPKQANWPAHLVTRQGSTNSLDIADFDHDGDADIVTGEHRGRLRVVVWENTDCGSFEPRLVDSGKESHLGTKAADMDDDGDIDLVSIAWDEPALIHLWRNDAIRLPSVTSSPP
jgi:hypothetical protein